MTSTRLPGKVLLGVMGRSMLSYQLERVSRVEAIDRIVIATTTNAADGPGASFAKTGGFGLYRGSENDVLGRFQETAEAHVADTVPQVDHLYDLALIVGVLIHINPDALPAVYDNLYAASGRYILVAEYYSPNPVSVLYRGHTDRLFKRDFAGEMLDRFSDLKLFDYGFCYRWNPNFPLDHITRFLLEKS
jgi:hypothetical protein